MKYTLGTAAKETGLSKTSISRAVKSGRISATKDENGQYQIDPAELFRVFPPGSKGVDDLERGVNSLLQAKQVEIEHLVQLLKLAEELGNVLRDQLTRERERSKRAEDQIDRLLPPPPSRSSPPPAKAQQPKKAKSWWERLWGTS